MIFTLNHHTSYSYSKFTCRPGYLVSLDTFAHLKPELTFKSPSSHGYPNATFQPGEKSEAFQPAKAGSLTPDIAYNDVYSFASAYTSHGKVAHEHNDSRIQQATFFRMKPLLCWHNDLSYYNLRLSFLNTLKALHLCWSAVRNNRKIGFVGVGGDLLNQASNSCLTSWFKTQSLLRSSLPRLNRNLNQNVEKLNSVRQKFNSMRANKKVSKLKRNFVLQGSKGELMLRGYTSWMCGLTRNVRRSNLGLDNALTPDQNIYALSAKFTKSYEASNVSFFGTTRAGRYSNPGQSLGFTSSHLASLRAHAWKKQNVSHWSQLAYRLGELGLKAPHSNFDLSFNPIRPPFKHGENVSSHLKVYDAFSNLQIRSLTKSRSQRLIQNAAKQQAQIINWCLFSHDQSKFKWKQARSNVYLPYGKKTFRGCFYLNYRNRVRIRRGNFVYKTPLRVKKSTFKRNLRYKPYYNKMMRRTLWFDNVSFVTNPNLKQADVLFFVHPDKASNMVCMAKNLRVPTIGIVSGLKSKHASKLKHQVMSDGVNYPIVGNPDNHFSILLLLRTFMRVISKARC